ncbi:MAG: VWA domain-containing protein [Roseiflexaceae bacterium]
MRRTLLLLALLLLTALPAQAQAPLGARVAQVDTSAYPIVRLYVSVTDAAGKPLPGLAARDFTITEDGQPVTIDSFVGGGAGAINTALVIDRSGSMDESDKIEGAREAAQAFVRQMRPGDRTAVIAFSNEPQLVQPFTSDTARLERAIRRIRPDGSTALYDSMIAGVDALKGLPGRRALLLLTDGRDILSTGDPTPASRASLDEAIKTAVDAGISVQAIGLGERGTSDLLSGIDESVLRRIADQTGGEYFYTPGADQLADLYRSLSADMQQEYVIAYRSPRPFYDGTRRDIQVSVGGAPAATGAYVERHMIDVHSAPLVGLALLLPILGALLLPGLLRRRQTTGRPPTADRRPPTMGQPTLDGGASTIVQSAGGATLVAADLPRCRACAAPLAAPDARFCMACGADQTGATEWPHVERAQGRRFFCDQCGRPLRAGSRFCSACGATAPLAHAGD